MQLANAIRAAAPTYPAHTTARILTFDIERRPQIGMYFDARTDYQSRERQLIRSSTISWAAKWYADPEILYDSVGEGDMMFVQPEHTPGYRDMIDHLTDLLDQADIVAGYNSIRFDAPKIKGERVRLGIPEPRPFRHLDLMRTTKTLGFDYSSLAETLSALGLEGKLAHQGFTLWPAFMHGDPDARKTMELYNRQDVSQTEAAMDAMRPILVGHPNLGLWAGVDASGAPIEVCHNCGGAKIVPVETRNDEKPTQDWAHTAMSAYALVQCAACKFFMRRNFIKARVTLRPVR